MNNDIKTLRSNQKPPLNSNLLEQSANNPNISSYDQNEPKTPNQENHAETGLNEGLEQIQTVNLTHNIHNCEEAQEYTH